MPFVRAKQVQGCDVQRPGTFGGTFAELSNHGKLCMYGRYLAMYNL
nr:MAG TPA: hypothetical protein [Caudoviricetes sp.]